MAGKLTKAQRKLLIELGDSYHGMLRGWDFSGPQKVTLKALERRGLAYEEASTRVFATPAGRAALEAKED